MLESKSVGIGVLRLGVCLHVLCWRAALADGFRNPPDGPYAVGRSGGHIAQIDDLTAVIHNPANLPDIAREPGAQAAATVGYATTRFNSTTGQSTESCDPYSFLPAICAAFPFAEGNCVLGFGVNVPFGRSSEWDERGPLRYAAPHHAALSVVNIRPVVALRLNPDLSVAVGIDAAHSRIEYRQYMPLGMPADGAGPPDGEMRLDASGWGVGGNLAVAWRPAAGHRLAVAWRSSLRVDHEGNLDIDNLPSTAGMPRRNRAETSMEFPAIVGAGYGVDLGDAVRVEAQVEWIGFSSFDTLDVEAGAASTLIPASVRAQNWNDTWTFGIGGDWRVAPGWLIRMGFLYLPSPVPDSTFAPFMADDDQPVMSLGTGYRSGGHALDLGWATVLFDGRRIRDNNNPAYDGEYDLTSSLVSVSYRLSF